MYFIVALNLLLGLSILGVSIFKKRDAAGTIAGRRIWGIFIGIYFSYLGISELLKQFPSMRTSWFYNVDSVIHILLTAIMIFIAFKWLKTTKNNKS
jgi:hypothetical protein